MITYSDLLAAAHAEAIANTLDRTELSVHREICRAYSKKFHTPLHLVLQMNPEEVILAYYEDQMDGFDEDEDLEKILDRIYTLEDPEYARDKAKDLEDFIEKAEKDEEERLAAGKPIHKDIKNEPSLKNDFGKEEKIEEKRPTRGSINLEYLSREEED